MDANDNDFSRLAGYSVEKYCQRFVDPPEQRLHRAYILAKYVHILDSDEFAWDSPNKTLFADLSEKYNISFVAGADHQGDVSIQKGITNMGRMPEDEFYKELALGRLVVGVGKYDQNMAFHGMYPLLSECGASRFDGMTV